MPFPTVFHISIAAFMFKEKKIKKGKKNQNQRDSELEMNLLFIRYLIKQ